MQRQRLNNATKTTQQMQHIMHVVPKELQLPSPKS